MDAALHLASALALLVVGAAAILLWTRLLQQRLALRLLRARHDQLRASARGFIDASGEAPSEVCANLDSAVRALAPSLDAVLFFERDAGELTCRYASGSRAQYFLNSRVSLERETSALTIAALELRRLRQGIVPVGVIPGDRSFVCVPLVDAGRSIGVFYAGSPYAVAIDVEDDIATLVDLATPAYRVALERETDRKRATIDALTGLLTPRAFRAHLSDAVALAAVNSERLALLFLDTDSFKSCNDTLGHAAGDLVLRAIARLLAAEAAGEAVVARNGGDEFCILLAGFTKTDAVRRAERIRAALEAYPFETLLNAKLPKRITASIGVAAYPSEAEGWEQLLERADKAMYHSKSLGRNRVSFYGLGGNLIDLHDSSQFRLDSSALSAFRAGSFEA